jgi:ribose transport system substrate-binding protein
MRKQFPQFLVLAVVVSTIVLFTGCKKTGSDANTDNSGVKNRQFVIGMSQCNLGEPWRVQMNADIQAAAAKHPEFKVIFKDAQNDTLKQRSHVEEFVSSKVDLLIISPKEAQPLTEPVARAMDAGIPVIVLDRRLLGDKYTCFIGADNKKIGKAAGEWVVKVLGGKGNVVELMGLQTSTPGQDRHSGFLEGIAGSDIKIIFSADMKWLEPNARQEMESALSRFDTIDLVYAHNDPGAHGAYLAAKAAGREKAMKFVGIDALPQEGVAYVQQGIIDATFQYPTGGADAIETGLKLLTGEKVPKEIVLGTRSYDKNTVAQGGQELK